MAEVTRWVMTMRVWPAILSLSSWRSRASVRKSRAEKLSSEEVDGGVLQHRPGDGQALLLASGQVLPRLDQLVVVARPPGCR